MNRKVTLTADGSPTIYLPSLNQHYHSIHGAVQESKHVFMKMGWEKICEANDLSVLEIGFGTGLNALLVLIECIKETNRHVSYTAIEAFPLEEKEIASLNYAEQLNFAEQQN